MEDSATFVRDGVTTLPEAINEGVLPQRLRDDMPGEFKREALMIHIVFDSLISIMHQLQFDRPKCVVLNREFNTVANIE